MAWIVYCIDILLLNFIEYAERESHDIWGSETDNLW